MQGITVKKYDGPGFYLHGDHLVFKRAYIYRIHIRIFIAFVSDPLHHMAGPAGDDPQAVAAPLMTPMEKSDGRRSGGICDDAAFNGRAFQPGRRGGIACRTRGAPAVPLAPDQ